MSMRNSAALRKYEVEDFEEFVPASTAAPAPPAETAQDPSHGHLCDLPPCIHGLTLGVWAVFFLVLWVTFWSSGNALSMIAVSTAYGAMFFGVPAVMGRMHPERPRARSTIAQFLKGRFDTLYGPVKGMDAVLQIIIVPAAITLGAIAIGIIISFARAGS
jgi:hypothetical protein